MQTYPALDERSARILIILLHEQPLASFTEMKRLDDGKCCVCFTDLRDNSEHVLTTAGEFIAWIDTVIKGHCLFPLHALCPACSCLHDDHTLSGQLFRLCLSCQIEIAELGLEEK